MRDDGPTRWRAVYGIALWITGCSGLSAEESGQLQAQLAQASAVAEALEAARVATLRQLASLPAIPASRCDPSVILTSHGRAPSAGFRLGRENGNFRVVTLAELVPGQGARIAAARELAETYRTRLAPDAEIPIGKDELVSVRSDLQRLQDPQAWFRHEITLVTLEQVDPQVVGPGTFAGGFRRGFVAVYDYAARSAACAAPVSVRSSSVEEVGGGSENRGLAVNIDVRYWDAALSSIGVQNP